MQKKALFYTFLAIFAATAVITLLGLVGVVTIQGGYLKTLFGVFIAEIGTTLTALFKGWFIPGGISAEEEKLEGYWWQFVLGKTENVLSFVDIHFVAERRHLVLEADSYDGQGNAFADWHSTAAVVDPATLELRYFWEGHEPNSQELEFSGVGYAHFANEDVVRKGSGWFTRGDLRHREFIEQPQAILERASAEDARKMKSEDAQLRRACALAKHARWVAETGVHATAGH